MHLVHGVGYNDGKYPTKVGGKHLKEYTLWRNMISRCYSEKIQEKRPTYIGCFVSENFKSYSYFYEWCQDQVGFELENTNLDKDLLVKGNKVYSETTCVFIPQEVNFLLTKRQNFRGCFPLGVHHVKHIDKYAAEVNVNGVKKRLGYFDTPYKAFCVYKSEKEKLIKRIAKKNKHKISLSAYNALVSYQVDIDD